MQFVKIAGMCLIREKFEPLRNVIFLAILNNSIVIEMCDDMLWISYLKNVKLFAEINPL
jgi:hypothetical protein